MATVISFDNWVKSNRVPLPRQRKYECHACGGSKKEISEKTGKVIRCKTCQGHGLISGRKTLFDPRKELYIEAVTDDLKRYCEWSGRDPQKEIEEFLSGIDGDCNKVDDN